MHRFVLALLLMAVCSAATADPTFYTINRTVGAGSVSGFIETDGTTGVLAAGNILDWNLLLNDGTDTFTLLGPLSGANSEFGLFGSGLSATSTNLIFQYSDASFAIFQAPTLFTGFTLWCMQGTVQCTSETSPGDVVDVFGPNQFTSLAGRQVVGTVQSIPEPATAALVLIGLAGLGFASRRKSS